MLALFSEGRNALRSAVCSFFGGILLAILLFVGIGAPQAASAVSACSFSCRVTLGASAQNCTETAPPYATCDAQCTQLCGAIGMTYDTRDSESRSTCSLTGDEITLGSRARGTCSPCQCRPTTALACTAIGTCRTACTNTCGAAAARVITEQGAGSGIACVDEVVACEEVSQSGAVYLCRSCITSCLADTNNTSTPAPRTCYTRCSTTALQNVCTGISEAEAGVTSGVVSGSGDSRSRIQSGTSAAANEAASLPPGACVQRAIAADAANNSLILMAEATFSAPSTTWMCRRVCSEQEQGGCVTGGCPGDASVRCCAPSLGIPVAQQCGARGAATGGGAASGEGSPSTAGPGAEGSAASGSGTPGAPGGASSGGVTNQVLGSSQVTADSGGLTRLILPSCIENGDCQVSDMFQVALNAIRFLFGLAGVLLLVVFVYAGIEFLIAGDAASVKTATDRIKKALIGLFFMFFGYTLVNFLVGMFVNA